jgi:dienelactone hydrolase
MQPRTLIISRRRFLATSAALLGGISLGRAEEPLAKLPTFDEEMKRALREAPLGMQFKGTSPAELASWQGEFAAKLRSLIGPHRPPARWSAEPLSTTKLADHTREEWLLKADGVPSLPLYVLRPLGGETDRFPVVLTLHGHGEFGHDVIVGIEATPKHTEAIRGANYDYGRQLVREGYLVVAPCFTPFGRRAGTPNRAGGTDPCAVAFVRLSFLGQTLLGANLRDAMWSLDYACQRADARADRVACVGLSYGGRMTMVVSALDPRIKAAVVSGALNVFQERALGAGYSCGAQVIPGLLAIGDTPEIGSLIAPRPCIWEMGSRDSLIVPGWAEKAIERLQRAYKAAEKPDHLQFHRFEGGHQWSGVTARTMLAAQLKI